MDFVGDRTHVLTDLQIFSALNSMLPSSKTSLQKGGLSPKAAAWTLIGSFLAGALGIQIVSRILHHYIPHSVVDCDHSHDEENGKDADHEFQKPHAESDHSGTFPSPQRLQQATLENGHDADYGYGGISQHSSLHPPRRPSLQTQISTKFSQLVSRPPKQFCDEHGQCFGYSDPCGQECFKIVQARDRSRHMSGPTYTRPSGLRTMTMPSERQPLLPNVEEDPTLTPIQSSPTHVDGHADQAASLNGHAPSPLRKQSSTNSLSNQSATGSEPSHPHPSHHHHVPTNAFLSIGLQTSIAIALHKIPEGFILFSTNHASPRLGFSVFLALFIHNFTEGFSLCLPLYLAIKSRWKSLFWASLLGGASQPLGAGVAALWFKIAGSGDGGNEPGEAVYGVMFAVTAGIMASVGLQLFGESLELTHSRKLCFTFAFVGMGILGVSSALTS